MKLYLPFIFVFIFSCLTKNTFAQCEVNDIASQAVCNLATTTTVSFTGTATTFTWINDQPSIGLIPAGTGNIPAFTAINLGTSPVVATITVTPSNGACTGTAKSFTITVNPTPVVNPIPDQVVCNGTSTMLITFSGSGTTYNWTNDKPSIGLNATGTGNIPPFTAINTGTSPIVANLTVTPEKNTCTGLPQTFTVTVNPTLTPAVSIKSSPKSNKICPGTFVTFVATPTNTGGGIVTYTWSVNGVTKKTGPENFYGKSNWNEGDKVVCSISVANGTCVPGSASASATFTVHLQPNIAPVVDLVASDDSICEGDAVTFTAHTNLDIADVDSFFFKVNGITVQSGTDSTYVNASLVNNDLVTCEITVTGCVTSNTATSNTILVAVANKSIPAVTISASENTVCNGTAVTFTATTLNTGGGAVEYIFKVNGVDAQTDASNLYVTDSLVNNDQVSCEINITNGSCLALFSALSAPVTMSVVDSLIPSVSIAASPGNAICSGSEVTFTAAALQTGGSLVLYNWTVNGDTVKNGIDSFYVTTALSNGDAVICEIKVNEGTCFSSDTALSPALVMTVKPTPDVNIVSNQIVCNGNSTATIIFDGSVGGATYIWTNSNSTIGLSGNGVGDIQSFPATDTSATLPVIATITVTPEKDACTGDPVTFTFTVNPTPVADPIADQVVCNGDTTLPVTFTGTINGTTYNWINMIPSIGLIGSGAGDIPAFTVINTGTTPIVDTLIVTPQKDGCDGPEERFTITVNPTPSVNVVPDQIVCNGTSTALITFTGNNVAGTTFNWTGSNSTIGLGTSGSNTIPATTVVNSDTSDIIDTITVTPTSAAGCTGASKTFTITVKPTPAVTILPDQQFTCNGAQTVQVTFSGSTGTTFNWTNNNTSIGLTANGSGDIDPFTAIDTSDTSSVVATITVTPAKNGCSGTPQPLTITVKPTPTATVDLPDQTVCNGDMTLPVTFTGSVAGTTFSWINNDTLFVHSDSVSGEGNVFPAALAINPDTTPHIATISVTPKLDGCDGPAESFTITVNPTPMVNSIKDTTYCNGEATGNIEFSSAVANPVFYWMVSGDPIGLESGNGYYLQNFVATNTSSTVKTAVISVKAIANGCEGPDSTFTITVNPSPTQPLFTSLLLNIYPVTLCQGSENINFNINTPAASNEVTYQWSSSIPSGVSIGDDNNPNTVISFFDAGTYEITATLTNEPGLGSCTASESQVVFVTEKNDTLAERNIILKNPGNMLVYPDNSMYHFEGYQWGYDTMMIAGVDTMLGRAHAIDGQVYQFFIPDSKFISGNSLNTHDYAYWVLLKPDTCETKVYYNGPYAQKRMAETIGIDSAISVNVYPNPNNGSFTISFSGNIYGTIDTRISNTLGQLIYKNTFEKLSGEASIKIENLAVPEGVYLLELRNDDDLKISRSILITR